MGFILTCIRCGTLRSFIVNKDRCIVFIFCEHCDVACNRKRCPLCKRVEETDR